MIHCVQMDVARKRTPGPVAKAFLPEGDCPFPPTSWMDWLEKIKGLSISTRSSYMNCVRIFLGHVLSLDPTLTPSLYSAWDVDICDGFFDKLKDIVKPTSVTIYFSALALVRRFMIQEGSKPSNHIALQDRFGMMAASAHRARKKAIAEEKGFSTKEKGVLRSLYLEMYHSTTFWSRFDQLVTRVRSRENLPLSKEDLSFANGFLIVLITAQNFKRAGNLSLLEGDAFFEEVNAAFADFRFRFPDEEIGGCERRLDRTKCVAAVAKIPVSSKVGITEYVVVLSPRDQQALIQYFKLIRQNGPCKPETTKFFINSKGKALGKDVWVYLQKIADQVGINDLTFNTLRRALETENALHIDPSFSANKEAVSTHLGHGELTAERDYRIDDGRQSVQAANQILFRLEQLGEEPVAPTRTLLDEVSEVVCVGGMCVCVSVECVCVSRWNVCV